MENYEYKVEEKSLTQDFLIKYIWMPVSLRIPNIITPNMISIFGFFMIFFTIVGLWFVKDGFLWGYLVAAASTFIYMLCDNVDGLHARRTKKTSKLGEFLDHWLDSMAFVVVNSCIAYSFGLTNWLFAAYIILMMVAFYTTMWEHHYTGVFISGKIGSNESLLIYISFYVFSFFVGKPSWLVYDGNSFFAATILLTGFAIVGSIATTLACLVRVKKYFFDVAVYCSAVVTIGYFLYSQFMPEYIAAITLALTNSIFCGKLIKEHLLKVRCHYRYTIICFFVAVAVLMLSIPQLQQYIQAYEYFVIAVLAITALYDATQTIKNI